MGAGGAPLPLGLRPLRHVGIVFSESARDALIANVSPAEAWRRMLYPTAGAWGALVRGREPTSMVVDWQLEAQPAALLVSRYAALVAPAEGTLLALTETALQRFVKAGGVLIRLSATDHWERNASRPALGAALVAELTQHAGPPPVKATGAEDHDLHVLAHRDTAPPTHAANATVIYISDDFVWCIGANPEDRPEPQVVRGVVVSFRLPHTSQQTVHAVTAVLYGQALEFAPSATEKGLWLITLPNFRQFTAMLVEHSGVDTTMTRR